MHSMKLVRTSHRRIAALTLAVLATLDARTRAGAAETQPACQAAIDRYDAEMTGRADDAALAAARQLEKTCATPDTDLARAVSRRAMVFHARKDMPATIAAFEESVRLGPENPTLRMSLCGVYTEAKRYPEAIAVCRQGLEIARAQDDGSQQKHDRVIQLDYNLALAKTKQNSFQCHDDSVFAAFDAFRAAHPDNAWVYQMLGAWAWDCKNDFDKGFALYKRSCELGQQTACEQVAYTEACRCKKRSGGDG
jgi:tetratricopeptide (TPR) repeat protein